MSTRNGEALRQRQIRFASERVFQWNDRGPKERLEKVKTRLQGLPIEVRTYGLSVALATLLREGRDESKAIAECLAEWLLGESPVRVLKTESGGKPEGTKPLELLRRIVAADRGTYSAVQTDAMGLCEQLKLLSAAVVAASKPEKDAKEDAP